jgi:hypothetical protein
MNNQLNQNLQNIAMAKKSGRNPQQIMQTMLRSNPQLQQTMTQMQNMAQGKTPREFIMQLAKQNGADEMALAMLAQLFDN